MKKVFLCCVLICTIQLSFAFKDSDLDGVEDSLDRCTNTPILELVDRYGCPLKKGKFYLKLGTGFLKEKSEKRIYSTASIAYSYEGFYLSFTTKYYLHSSNLGSGLGDSSIFISYSRFFGERVYLMPGIRLKLPTGNSKFSDGKVDLTPSVVLDYLLNRFDMFAYASYTFRGDRRFKDTISLSGGFGYELRDDLYVSTSYDISESTVRNGYNYYLSLFLLYDISSDLYATLSYSRGMNDRAVDHSATLKLGIRF